MRKSIVAGLALTFVATGALAQMPPAQSSPQNGVINTPSSSNRQVTAPVKGRNSFTEGEAKSRIEKQGFASVSNLAKDNDGVWRGRAIKDGKQVEVSLDYQGNVIAGSGTTGTPMRAGAGR